MQLSSLALMLLASVVLALPATDVEPTSPSKLHKRVEPQQAEAMLQTVLRGFGPADIMLGPEGSFEAIKDLLEFCLRRTMIVNAYISRERRLEGCCLKLGIPSDLCNNMMLPGYLSGRASKSRRKPAEGWSDSNAISAVDDDEQLQQQNSGQSLQIPDAVQDAAGPALGLLGAGLVGGSQLAQGQWAGGATQ